ncbi:DNA primase [Actinomycetaceae bacterium MB13-C1-2]|nr:DNA primase [Actinomycetaceae bacterium MB13-C1-2]
MSSNAREALSRLVAALEHHLDLAQNIDVVQPSLLEHAEDLLRDAFFTYDDTLFTEFDVELPFEILDDSDEDEDDDEDLEDEDPDFIDSDDDSDNDFEEID